MIDLQGGVEGHVFDLDLVVDGHDGQLEGLRCWKVCRKEVDEVGVRDGRIVGSHNCDLLEYLVIPY